MPGDLVCLRRCLPPHVGGARQRPTRPSPSCPLPLPLPLLSQAMVARSGAAAALVELCKSPSEELREAAAVALWDLSYDSALGREAIARAGAPCLVLPVFCCLQAAACLLLPACCFRLAAVCCTRAGSCRRSCHPPRYRRRKRCTPAAAETARRPL